MFKEINCAEEVNGGWISWRNHVLLELTRINENVQKLADSDTEIRIDIGRLKLCSALWGGLAGVLGTLVVALIYFALTK